MAITTIALHVEPETPEAVDAALALPLALAEVHGAHLAALVFATSTFVGVTAGHAANPPENEGALREEHAAQRVRQAAGARGLRHEVRGRSSFTHSVGEVFADQMRVSDLGIMTYASGADIGRRFLATAGIFASGRPLLLVPPDGRAFAPPARILVAWDASPAAVRAVHGAMPLLRRSGVVTIVSVTDDKEFRPGQSGTELAHLLARHGAQAAFQPVQRGRGGVTRALLEMAQETRADLLVMGAVRHTPLHNLVFGTATMDLLDRGPDLPTLLTA